jgi:FdrA protein
VLQCPRHIYAPGMRSTSSLLTDAEVPADRVVVRTGSYHDSIELMLMGRRAAERPGVHTAVASMATPLNLTLLREQGFHVADARTITPNDLVIAVRGESADAADAAIAAFESELAAPSGGPRLGSVRSDATSLRSLARRDPELAVALISVPAAYAAYECAAALDAGLHVFCFSDGIELDAELALKRRAAKLDLLFMGPDCGTAILDGVALGFANRVARGPVGIVAASGTGAQEVSCLLDAAGVGISQLIGVGGRDLGKTVGGLMARRALERLALDDGTEVIVVISKPPDRDVAEQIAAAAASTGKPAVLAFPGAAQTIALPAGVELESSLERAAARAAELTGHALPPFDEAPARPPSEGWIRGLFSGGTLCTEAMTIVSARVGKVTSNIPLRPEWRIDGIRRVAGHAFVDFGADELTQGRAHPMIDPALRLERFEHEAADPAVAAIVLDVVLGYGAHPDPASWLAPAVAAALATRPELNVVVSLCGAAGDPQDLDRQRQLLLSAGATVTRSTARAAELALEASVLPGGVAGGR